MKQFVKCVVPGFVLGIAIPYCGAIALIPEVDHDVISVMILSSMTTGMLVGALLDLALRRRWLHREVERRSLI